MTEDTSQGDRTSPKVHEYQRGTMLRLDNYYEYDQHRPKTPFLIFIFGYPNNKLFLEFGRLQICADGGGSEKCLEEREIW